MIRVWLQPVSVAVQPYIDDTEQLLLDAKFVSVENPVVIDIPSDDHPVRYLPSCIAGVHVGVYWDMGSGHGRIFFLAHGKIVFLGSMMMETDGLERE